MVGLTTGPAGHYSDSGTDVALQIRFFKVENVKAAEGSMRLKVRHPIAFFALFFPIRALLRTVLARAQTGGCVSIRIRRSQRVSCYVRSV